MAIENRFRVIEAGFTGDAVTARSGLSSPDAAVRASALRALMRIADLHETDIADAIADDDHEVRRVAAECAAQFPSVTIHHLLNDTDVFVAEMTAWSLGERTNPTDDEVNALIHHTVNNAEAVVREACAAALGSLGDERGLPAILIACQDKPAVRRRAVLALAPFDGEQVDAALRTALEDRDWQVRQNAEILLHPRHSDS